MWWPLALQRDGDQFTAALPDVPQLGSPGGRTPLPQVPVSLRVVLRDAQGNTVTNDLTPAFGYGGDRLP